MLQFTNISLENSASCAMDYVAIYEGLFLLLIAMTRKNGMISFSLMDDPHKPALT